jgi:DNA mismatch repair protein MutL
MAIRLLPEATANRIAAGEVVERPAAVVKELVENALDAGASRIRVTLEEGGLSRILVEDDGSGMAAEDLALCVERHATSKLPEEAALFAIGTLGFRGEALPSIGAVARLTLTSRQAGGEPHAITVEGGRKGEVRPASGAKGTRVEVRDLFFATPARRKFLRTPRAEADAALDALRRLALAWPEVGFEAVSDGRAALNLQPADRAGRVRDLLGEEFAAAALPVEGGHGEFAVAGFAGHPAYTKASAVAQHFVVNSRPVKDPLLRAALRAAYAEVTAPGRHPAAALFLALPPAEVDVNVHPMKTELRFRDGAAVRGAVISALRRALGVGAGTAVPGFRASSGWSRPVWPAPQLAAAPGAPSPTAMGWPPGAPRPAGFAEALAEPPRAAPLPLAFPAPRPAAAPAALPAGEGHPLGRALAQILDTYILAEAPDGALVLVDQHAAHERLTHERLKSEWREGRVRAQPLLIPAVVELPGATRLLDAAPDLARMGLEIEGFGPGAVLVRALPAVLGAADPAPILRDMAEELEGGEEALALEARVDAALARLACHGSIRAGRRLAAAEMDALLRQMEATPRAATCSHGRPTFLRLSKTDFERLFGR